MVKRTLVVAAAVLGVAACSHPSATYNSPVRPDGGLAGIQMQMTSADLRSISVRNAQNGKLDPATGKPVQISCTEPPPDVAMALSTALQLAANGTGPNGVGGGFNVSNSTAESLAALAGRVPAVVALRDGLFRACEAYANGMIGDTTYALVVSRYGELLVTLMLGEDLAQQPAAAAAFLSGVNLGQQQSQKSSSTNNSGDSTKKTSAATPEIPASTPATAVAAVNNLDAAPRAVRVAALGPIILGAAAPPAGGGAKQGQQDNPPVAQQPQPQPSPTPAPNGNGTQKPAQTTQNQSSPPDPSKSIEKMQSNFFNLGITGPLAIACLNEHDLTRPRSPGQRNDLIDGEFCRGYLNQLRRVEVWAAVKEADGEILARALEAVSNGKSAPSVQVVQAIAQVIGSAQCDFQQFDLEETRCPPTKPAVQPVKKAAKPAKPAAPHNP